MGHTGKNPKSCAPRVECVFCRGHGYETLDIQLGTQRITCKCEQLSYLAWCPCRIGDSPDVG